MTITIEETVKTFILKHWLINTYINQDHAK